MDFLTTAAIVFGVMQVQQYYNIAADPGVHFTEWKR